MGSSSTITGLLKHGCWKKELPLARCTKVVAALQRLLGPVADEAAATGVIQRRREFTPMSLVMTLVLGHLWKPRASVGALAQMPGAEVGERPQRLGHP